MKNELELKYIAGYLPYDVIFITHNGKRAGITPNGCFTKINSPSGSKIDKSISFKCLVQNYKIALRPLSDLTKEITHNGETFVPIEQLDNFHNFSTIRWDDIELDPTRYPYTIVEKLIEWHFDIHNLIEQGLAIDLNTIEML